MPLMTEKDTETDRPTWDEIWMDFASKISMRSVDPKYKVGSVIVNAENTQVLSIGYNGDQKGGPNKRNSLATGGSGFIHAEINSLIKLDYNNPCRKKMYLTLSPCIVCAQALVNAGIEEVVYGRFYEHGSESIKVLEDAGIVVRSIRT
jgi:dCMP deaminase